MKTVPSAWFRPRSSLCRPMGRCLGIAACVLFLWAGLLPAAEEPVPDEENTCILCHGNEDIWEKDTLRFFVSAKDLESDIHWQKGIRCHDCHGGSPTSSKTGEAHLVGEPGGLRLIAKPADVPGFCGRCHAPGGAKEKFQFQGKADQVDKFWASAHGQHLKKFSDDKTANVASCSACHPKHKLRRAADPQSSIHPQQLPETCGACHKEAKEGVLAGVHKQAGPKDPSGVGTPLDCGKCHGDNAHDVRPVRDPASPIFVDHQVQTCGKCHEKGLESYLASVHGHGLQQSGLQGTAICSSCHGSHGIFKRDDERSRLYVTQVDETCAKCHRLIGERLAASVHGRGGAGPGGASEKPAPGGDIKRKPTCTDCHQGHDLPHPGSARFRLHVHNRCGNCHAGLSERYASSLHGALTEVGYGPAAKCSDCHGAHEILPVADPQSPVHLDHRLQTCRKCHPSAAANLVSFDPHADHRDAANYPVLYSVNLFMELLLASVFCFFGLHTLLWFIRSWVHAWRHGRPPRIVPNQPAFLRFAPIHRWLHATVIISFLGLAITGLPLKYSGRLWAQRLAQGLGGFGTTAHWHHLFGIVTFVYFFTHLIWLSRQTLRVRQRGVSWLQILGGPDSPVPNLRDFTDLGRMLRWFLGLGPKPVFERWTYWEKFDYWAVFWGVAIIGSTGLLLWLPDLFCQFLPGQLINIAKVIHSEEALLATGFIFSIHFFNTHLRAEKFPIDMSMLSGYVSEAELEEERPELMARLRAAGTLEQSRATVPSRRVLGLITLCGFLALLVGLALLAGIVAGLLHRL